MPKIIRINKTNRHSTHRRLQRLVNPRQSKWNDDLKAVRKLRLKMGVNNARIPRVHSLYIGDVVIQSPRNGNWAI